MTDRMSVVADPSMPSPTPEESERIAKANRQAAYVSLVAAAVAIIGAFQVWLRIQIDGLTPPGSAQSGWDGGDGRTIVVAGIAGAVAGIALLIGRRDLWVKVVLLIAGAITTIIAIVNVVDAGSKAHDIRVQFGIPAQDVTAMLGIGLYLVAVAGAALIGAGLRMRTSPS
jgi:hypothetical protein